MQKTNRPLYFIHGWGLGPEVWATFIAGLNYAGDIQALELPGYGQSIAGYKENTSIDAIVNQLSKQITKGAILVGWSLGGMIAIKLAETEKNKISALILLASTPCFAKKADWPCGVDDHKLQAIAANLKHDRGKTLRTFIAEVALGDPSPRETIRKLQTHAIKHALNEKVLNDGLEILRKQDLRENLKQLECPVGMILGTKDQLVAFSTGKTMQATCPNIELMTIEAAGHAPFISQPEETANALMALVKNYHE